MEESRMTGIVVNIFIPGKREMTWLALFIFF